MSSVPAEAFRAAEAAMWASVSVSPEDRRLPLRRTGVSLRVQEAGDGAPVVFVHGASNSGVSWATLVSHLSDVRCIVVDRPGCGASEPLLRPWTGRAAMAKGAADLVVDVLDALELERAHMVGTSFGGFVALHGAIAHPDRVAGVIELGWTVGAPSRRLPLVMRAAALPGAGRLAAAMPVNERMVRSMFRRIGLKGAVESGRATPELVAAYTALLRHTPTMRNEIAVNRGFLTFRGLDKGLLFTDEELASIEAPCSFVWGRDDPFGGEAVARAFTARIPGATLQLVPGGHAVWIDDPAPVATAVRSMVLGVG